MSREHGGDIEPGASKIIDRHELESAVAGFRKHQSPEAAIELLSVAGHYGAEQEHRQAAIFLRTLDARLPNAVLEVIQLTDSGIEPNMTGRAASLGGTVQQDAASQVRYCRSRLMDEPRNTVLILDLARAYTVGGKAAAAERLVRSALALAPNHRLVLRRAARWMVHAGRAEEAWTMLRKHPRTPTDPWLMATEISLAEVLNRTPAMARQARVLLSESGLSPGVTTELSSAVGTMDFASGDTRRARRMLRDSLRQPTDNAVAQAQWLSKYDSAISVEPGLLRIPSASEARFFRAHQEAKWHDALKAAKEWQSDEPFSSRPAIHGSFLAANFSVDPLESTEIAKIGLRADPNDQLLRNNLVVGLILAGRQYYQEARKEFHKLRFTPDAFPLHVFRATSGLVRFTLGDWEGGRMLYQQAIMDAPPSERISVSLHWFNVESLFDADSGEVLSAQFDALWQQQKDPLTRALVDRFQLMHKIRLTAPQRFKPFPGKVLVDTKTGGILFSHGSGTVARIDRDETEST